MGGDTQRQTALHTAEVWATNQRPSAPLATADGAALGRSGAAGLAHTPDLTFPAHLPPAIAEQISRLRLARGRQLCRRSPEVALGAGVLTLSLTLVASIAIVWVCLARMPTLVLSASRAPVLEFVSAAGAVALLAAVASYATARWVHARSIPARGKTGAVRVGLLMSLVAIAGLLGAIRPWSFPSANVLVVPPLVAAQYIILHEATGGMVIYRDDTPVAYVQTAAGKWVEASVPPSATDVVVTGLPTSGPASTLNGVVVGIGGPQLAALRAVRDRLWFVAGALALWAAVAGVVQRRLWRRGPWSVPGPGDRSSTNWTLELLT
jgi:hypothetical protein